MRSSTTDLNWRLQDSQTPKTTAASLCTMRSFLFATPTVYSDRSRNIARIAPVTNSDLPQIPKMKWKAVHKANAEIAWVVEKNVDLNTPLAPFKGLSKVGGKSSSSL